MTTKTDEILNKVINWRENFPAEYTQPSEEDCIEKAIQLTEDKLKKEFHNNQASAGRGWLLKQIKEKDNKILYHKIKYKKEIENFADILRNCTNDEYKEYNEMLLNELFELKKEIEK